MILTQPNSPFSCTLHPHLAPHYYSLHPPSPPHSLTVETPHQEMCGNTSPISWGTPLPSSNTFTCLIMTCLFKIKRQVIMTCYFQRQRHKAELRDEHPSSGRGCPWLSPQQPISGGNAPALSQGQTQLGHGRWFFAGLGGEGRCCRCADQELTFLQQRLWRSPQSGSKAPTGSTLSRWLSCNFRNLFSWFCPHAIITYLLYIDCQIWSLWGGKKRSL